jgi:hypothetical protein
VRVSVSVGDVSVDLREVDMSNRQIRDLVRLCVDAAHYLPTKHEHETNNPIGFAASIERSGEYVRPDFEWVDDEE